MLVQGEGCDEPGPPRISMEYLLARGANKEARGFFDSLRQAAREFLQGMAVHETTMVALKERAALERLLFLILFGEALGIPVLRPYYALRLLPHACTKIEAWKRYILRERDWTDWSFE